MNDMTEDERNTEERRYTSVVVCTHNRADLCAGCLEHLVRQDLSPREYEILVIDNRSIDDTRAVVRRYGRNARGVPVRYCYEPELGLSASRNAGMEAARGEIIAFIDDDARAAPGWLRCLRETYARYGADVVGGRVELSFPHGRPEWLTGDLEGWLSGLDLGDRPRPVCYPAFLVGANISFRTEWLGMMGGFDTGLGRKGRALSSGEECELHWRMERAGARVYYSPGAMVTHLVAPERLKRGWFIRRWYHGGRAEVRMRVRFEGRIEALGYFFFLIRHFFIMLFRRREGWFRKVLSLVQLGGYTRSLSAVYIPPGAFCRAVRNWRRRERLRRRCYTLAEVSGRIQVGADRFIGEDRFLGYAVTRRRIELFFLAGPRSTTRLTIFAHLFPESDETLHGERMEHGFINLDHSPALPRRRWKPGRVFMDSFELPCVVPGRYRLRFGFIREDGRRVNVSRSADNSIETEWFVVE